MSLRRQPKADRVSRIVGLRYRYVYDHEHRGVPICEYCKPLMNDSLTLREKRRQFFDQDFHVGMKEMIWETYIEHNNLRERPLENIYYMLEELLRSENNDAYNILSNLDA